MKLRRLLVPLDGRQVSEAALPPALELAKGSGGRIYLLRVLETPTPTADALVQHRAASQKAEQYLAEMRQRAAREGALKVSTAVWAGAPAAAIAKAATLIRADMIVMATGGRTGPPRKMVGSVVKRVLRGTRCPVLVIRPSDAAVDTSLGDAVPLPGRPEGPPRASAGPRRAAPRRRVAL